MINYKTSGMGEELTETRQVTKLRTSSMTTFFERAEPIERAILETTSSNTS
jgi:hypothetical protein